MPTSNGSSSDVQVKTINQISENDSNADRTVIEKAPTNKTQMTTTTAADEERIV